MQPFHPFLYPLRQIWEGPLRERFVTGQLPDAAGFLAEWYHLIQMHTSFTPWIHPDIHLSSGGGASGSMLFMRNVNLLSGHKPALLLTEEDEVVAVIELIFSPGAHSDFHAAWSKLQLLAQAAEEGKIFLEMDPLTGRPNLKNGRTFSPDWVAVLAVVAKEGGFAVTPSYLKDVYENHPLWPRFAHFVGISGPSKVVFQAG
jgi:hypothetical protein